MTQRTMRPEMPGTQPGGMRATQGTGNFYATVIRSRLVRKRRLYDIRTEGGEVIPGCDAVLGGPKDDGAWDDKRVVAMTMESGRVCVLGPVGDENDAFIQDDAPPASPQDNRPSQIGKGDRSIEHNDIRLIFGANPKDLTIEIPGILRIEAQGIRFTKGGATGAKVVMFGPFVNWGTELAERVNAHEAWIALEVAARSAPGHPAPAAPYPTPGSVTPPDVECAVESMTVPEDTP